MKSNFKLLIEKYGMVAMVFHLSVFALSIIVFYVALDQGVDFSAYPAIENSLKEVNLDEASGNTWMVNLFLAYAATQAIKVVRIPLTIVATPIIARILPWRI